MTKKKGKKRKKEEDYKIFGLHHGNMSLWWELGAVSEAIAPNQTFLTHLMAPTANGTVGWGHRSIHMYLMLPFFSL